MLGSGYRATVDDIGEANGELLRQSVIGELRARKVTTLRNDVVFAASTKA